jgi:hypothetical protein
MKPTRLSLPRNSQGELLMKRGEVWTLRDEGYAGEAKSVIILQSDLEIAFESVILYLFTTFESDHIPTRILVCLFGSPI